MKTPVEKPQQTSADFNAKRQTNPLAVTLSHPKIVDERPSARRLEDLQTAAQTSVQTAQLRRLSQMAKKEWRSNKATQATLTGQTIQLEGDDEEYNTNIRMGKKGAKKHTKRNATDPTTDSSGATRRQESTLNRHTARLKAGEGSVVETVAGGAGPIKVVRLESTKEGNTPHLYGIKNPGGDGESGFHPRTPEGGGDYDSDSDDE